MADNISVTAGTGTTVATDDIGGVHYQIVKQAYGALDAATLVSSASPFPVREPAVAAPLTQTGATATTTDSQVIADNVSRKWIDVTNADVTNGVWISFSGTGTTPAAAVGTGAYLPPNGSGTWFYTGRLRAKSVAGTVQLSIVEW